MAMDNNKLLADIFAEPPYTEWEAWRSDRVLSPHACTEVPPRRGRSECELSTELRQLEDEGPKWGSPERSEWVGCVLLGALAVLVCFVLPPFVVWMASH